MIDSRVAFFAAALALSACSGGGASDTTNASNTTNLGARDNMEVAAANQTALAKALLAAGETFEALAETAFIAKPSELDTSIDAADGAARTLRVMAPASLSASLQTRLAAIREARKSGHRADLALASIEGFRDIVSEVPGKPAVPVDVSLLDYAGFRLDADAQSAPPRWEDMTKAMAFARERWTNISPLPAVSALRTRFDTVLTTLNGAIERRDAAGVRAAAKVELDMVDELEAAFAAAR